MARHNDILNYRYAPGLPTYGIDGRTGPQGLPGTSFYFSNIAIQDSAGNVSADAVEKLRNGHVLSAYSTDDNIRPYIDGDLVIDRTASLYKIVDTAGGLEFTYLATLSNVTDDDFFKYAGGRMYLDTDTSFYAGDDTDGIRISGVDIVNDPSYSADGSDTLLRVISGRKDTANSYNLVSLTARDTAGSSTLRISYNQDIKSFVINTDADIAVDSPGLYISAASRQDQLDSGWYRIAPQADPPGLLHLVYKQAKILFTYKTADIDTVIAFAVFLPKSPTANTEVLPDFIKVGVLTGLTDVIKEYVFTDFAVDSESSRDWYIIKFNSKLGDIIAKTVYISFVKGIEIVRRVTDAENYIAEYDFESFDIDTAG